MRTLRLMMALLPCFLIISCGGGGGPGGATVSGRSVDGYIQGAKIYVVPVGDTTSTNAVYGPATTDSEGRFRLTGLSPAIATSLSYQLLSIGGTDTATGVDLPPDTVYTAPMGSNVVTPLTTLAMETARKIAGSGMTQAALDQALANIAAVTGMDGNAILNDDPIAQGMNDPNTLKSLCLNTVLTQLDRQNVMTSSEGSFLDTIDAIANKLADSSALPQDVVSLMTAAALPDSLNKAKAEVITAGIHQGMRRMYQSYNAGPTGRDVGSKALASSMQSKAHSFLNDYGSGTDVDIITAINDLSNAIAGGTMGAVFSNMTTAADIGSSTVRNFIRDAAGSNGLAQLLGADVRTIPWGSAQQNAAVNRIARVAAIGKSRAAATAAAADNPCDGKGNGTASWGCSNLFDSATCSSASGTFEWQFTCSNNSPTSSKMILSNFNAMGMPLTGTIDVTDNALTFTNLSNGTSTFQGSLGLTSLSDGSIQFSVLNTLSVTGATNATTGWRSLTLDSFSRAKMIPTDTSGQNQLSLFLSGTGVRAGSGNSITLALNCDRIQSAIKTETGDTPAYRDSASVRLSGIVSDGSDIVALNNFGFNETRYFDTQLADAYLYKVSSFIQGSRVSTSRYGFAYFRGSDITFNANDVWQSGTMSLGTTP